MTEYRASWQAWARRNYSDQAIAASAAQAAIAAVEAGTSPRDASIRGHQAAIDAGGEYQCRPDKVGMALIACILLGAMFVPATLVGASKGSTADYIVPAVVIGLFGAGVAGLVMVRRNSRFFATRSTAGRRDWRGQVVSSIPRGEPISFHLRRGKPVRPLTYDEPDDSEVDFSTQGGAILPTTVYWWSDERITEFALVLGAAAE